MSDDKKPLNEGKGGAEGGTDEEGEKKSKTCCDHCEACIIATGKVKIYT